VLGLFWLSMLLLDWRYLVCFYLPSYYLGWVLIYAHTYVLHYGAQPGNCYANSVSSYHWLYNGIFFNNGYHQEHHWDPKAHWTTMPRVKQEILPHMLANRTRMLRGPHITLFVEEWLQRRRTQRATGSGAAPSTASQTQRPAA
jgi:fatty acid desaturase